MDEEPIFKISKYKIAENDLPAFHRVEEAHVTNSIPAEPGTLMIANGHEGVSGVTNYDIELYRNSRAFDIHSMSDYFDAYDNAVEKMAKEKKIWDLKSEWMTTKSKEALDSYADNFVIR
ncbi:MAG TPA: antibiotic biosynthesis monooxygenase, partial [Lactobacillus acetotolerans]|nr:antibiotic biosynthesis monooxygenase [Lactobacillus acetotolerans]